MKPNRNDPCSCGSGKKYKKCCYLTEQNSTGTLSDNQEYDDAFENQELLLEVLNSLRRFTLDKKQHIKKYYKIRKMHSEVVDAMIQYHDDEKFKQKVYSNAIPQTKGNTSVHLINSSFDLDTRDGAQCFYDMMIYKTFPNINCITEDFIQNRRYRKADKVEFLHSMLDSRLGLFEITGRDINEGYVYIRDIFTGTEYTIIDVGLSGDPNYTEFYWYTRIITYNGISFGTGLNLVFAKTDNFIQDYIQHHKKDYDSTEELLRFTQLYNHFSQLSEKVHVVTTTLK